MAHLRLFPKLKSHPLLRKHTVFFLVKVHCHM